MWDYASRSRARIFEWPMPEEVVVHAMEHKLDHNRFGTIFADGSVKYGHPSGRGHS